MEGRADYKWALLCGALVTAAGFLLFHLFDNAVTFLLILPGAIVSWLLGLSGGFHDPPVQVAGFRVDLMVTAATNVLWYALISFVPLRIRRHLPKWSPMGEPCVKL